MKEHSRADILKTFSELLDIMDELRAKCPWDKVQTWESLRTLSIEECYELADAILGNDPDEVREELGDLMLHLVFYTKIAVEEGSFDLVDVLSGINKKLIYRHPHIFSDVEANTPKEVEENWEKLKLKESETKTVLGGIPRSLPALIKAYRVQDKARGVGFDWDQKEQVWDKVEEEIAELKTELSDNSDQEKIEQEFGDVFFSLINAARLYGINPENALEKTNIKFIKRFNYLESKTISNGLNLKEMSLKEMDKYWDEAKNLE